MVNPSSIEYNRNTRRLAILFLLGAFCLSAFLLSKTWLDKPIPGCAAGAGCQVVLASKWAYLAGFPVSLAGVILYGALLILAGSSSLRPGYFVRKLETGGCLIVIFGAVWFSLVQILILHAFCPWCCSVHLLASIASILFLASRRAGQKVEKIPNSVYTLLRVEMIVPLLLVVAFAFFQSSESDPENVVDTALPVGTGIVTSGNLVSVYDGEFSFDPSSLPTLGSPDADKIIIVLTDYTCPHCRSLHQTLQELVEHQGGNVGIILLPAFRDPAAQELHRVMLTMWKEDPVYYETLSSGMIRGELPADPNKILTLAQSHSAGRFYEKAWRHAPWVERCFQLGQGLLEANDSRLETPTLPQIMIEGGILQGNPRLETLSSLLEQSPELETTPPSAKMDSPPEVKNSESDGEPQIKFTSDRIIMPVVPRGEKITHAFKFTNTGTGLLKILGVKTSCGCVTLQGWKQTVAPGEQGSLNVTFDSTRFNGKVSKPFMITSNATNIRGGVSAITMEADIWLPVALTDYKANYGVLLTGEKAIPKKITMTLTDDGPFKIGEPVSNNEYFNVTMEETKPGKEYILTVSIPKLHRRMENGEITIPLGHPKYPVLKIPAYARVANPIEPSPSFLMLPTSRLRAPMRRLITIHCHDRNFKDFNVTEFKTTGLKGITLDLKKTHTTRWRRIEVTFPAGFDPTEAIAKKTSIHIQTNHPQWKELTVPLRIH